MRTGGLLEKYNMSRTIDIIFTRDFSLTINDLWHYLLSVRISEAYGQGLPGQIIYFTGRSAECYRIREELETVRQAVLAKQITDDLFSEEQTTQFRRDIDEMKGLLKESVFLEQRKIDYARIKELFIVMYPQYMLGVFLPYRWKDDFLTRHDHTEAAITLLERIYQNRVYSEGMFNYVDHYLRTMMCEYGLASQYNRVMRLVEFETLIRYGSMPDTSVLEQRKQKYILYHDTVITGLSFDLFLRDHEYMHEKPVTGNNMLTIQGVVASKGTIITGQVQVILNDDEVKHFTAGNILVTTMTSPYYVPAMKQAKVIITDEGGITCHAAIVSRELGVPCVIGTKIATRVLKDGDIVEVDATSGVVKKLNRS